MTSGASWLFLVLDLVTLVVVLWAAADAVFRPASAYRVVGKWQKPAWLAILGVAAVVVLLGARYLSLFGALALVAAIVYLVDMRPKLREVRGGGRGGQRSGPYGPW